MRKSPEQEVPSTICPGLNAFLAKAKSIFDEARTHFYPGLKMDFYIVAHWMFCEDSLIDVVIPGISLSSR